MATDPATHGLSILPPAHSRSQAERVWQHYVDAWSDPLTATRLTALQAALTADFDYADRTTRIAGSYDDMAKHIGLLHEQYPGVHSQTVKLHLHHDVGLADYISVDGQGKHVLTGREYVEFAEDGRIRRVQSFYETE